MTQVPSLGELVANEWLPIAKWKEYGVVIIDNNNNIQFQSAVSRMKVHQFQFQLNMEKRQYFVNIGINI